MVFTKREVDNMGEGKSWSRRPHSAELKLRVLSECAVPGASIARIAQAHGLNAKLVHEWRRKAGVVLFKVAARGAARWRWPSTGPSMPQRTARPG